MLDINMPETDGLEFCRKIRNHIDCPIIFLTSRVTEQDKITGLQAGGDDYITKPFSLAELTARVEAHLRREGMTCFAYACIMIPEKCLQMVKYNFLITSLLLRYKEMA